MNCCKIRPGSLDETAALSRRYPVLRQLGESLLGLGRVASLENANQLVQLVPPTARGHFFAKRLYRRNNRLTSLEEFSPGG